MVMIEIVLVVDVFGDFVGGLWKGLFIEEKI